MTERSAPPARTPEEIREHCREECGNPPTRIICDEHFAAYGAALLEEAAREAKRGGCDCALAPCDHDEAGELIARRIRSLAEKHSLAVPEKELLKGGE